MLLPLFPIDVVLFPGTRAPLHIFEDRYRSLLRDILRGERLFGIVSGAGSEPPPGSVGVVAEVVTHQALDDGRSNILVRGTERFVVQELVESDRPYLMAKVVTFADEADAPHLGSESLRTLRALGTRCRRAMATLADLPLVEDAPQEPGELTWQVAATVPWDPSQGAPFLMLRTPGERAELLLRLLPGIVPDLERRASVHRKAGTNGQGLHPPRAES